MPRSASTKVATKTPRRVGRANGRPGPSGASQPERSRHRERLVHAMTDLCAERGYLNVSIADISTHAGASSKTFYEVFEDKEDCLLAAYQAAAAQLLATDVPDPTESGWRGAAHVVLHDLLSALQANSNAGRLLLVEALAGGVRVRAERDRVRSIIEDRAQRFLDGSSQDGMVLDLPAPVMVGAVRSVVSRHLRTRTEDRLPALTDDLLAWLESYAVTAPHERWSTGPKSTLPARAVKASGERAARAPEPLPRGRHRLPPAMIARSQRTRIIQGTANVMMEKGYAETTVTEIVAAAGISREVFYAHFENKQHAYLAAQQYATHHILEICTAAYFGKRHWPERVWAALETLIGILVANPALAHLRLVECYAAGPEAIENTEELKRAAAIFLEEGMSSGRSLPRLAIHAVSGAIFEVIYADIARGDFKSLPRRLPQLVYVATAPFLGPAEAIRSLEAICAGAVT